MPCIITRAMWRQGYSAFFAYEGAAAAFGQEQSVVAAESGRSTAKVSGPQNAGPLDRRVRPEGQKGAPSLEDVRGPGKSAGPRKRRSAARRIAGGACCTSAGGPKGLKAFGTGRSAGTGGCAHETGDGTNAQSKPPAESGSA